MGKVSAPAGFLEGKCGVSRVSSCLSVPDLDTGAPGPVSDPKGRDRLDSVHHCCPADPVDSGASPAVP